MVDELDFPDASGPGLLVLDQPGDGDLRAGLAEAGLTLGPTVGWGEPRGYEYLCRLRPPLNLLDAGEARHARDLVHLVRAARLLGPVVVVAHAGSDAVVECLAAGALDVIDRAAPPAERAARLRARLRRLPARGVRRLVPAAPGASAQRLLLGLLLHWRRPICCHDLRWLFGRPGQPLSLSALRARMHRVGRLLSAYRLRLEVDAGWGSTTYRAVPLPG
ncbi:hypothetical protein HC031_20240 [Planosporangium thailandense]|uniref:Uncharacterized protein n=1 Tax=Planosporangium thailandense TaxID=765197 RepID=A0ABX0Y122_9ACTN|nr:hypothetical protein [Planosporangium thailandense]NJC72028.1 hypothetical protein [Planosporangium thailandense]